MKKMLATAMLTLTMTCMLITSACAAVDFGFWRYEEPSEPKVYSRNTYGSSSYSSGSSCSRSSSGVDFGFWRYESSTPKVHYAFSDAPGGGLYDDYLFGEDGGYTEVWMDCPACFTGTCTHCNGKGWYTNPYGGGGKITCEKECAVCDGEGGWYSYR